MKKIISAFIAGLIFSVGLTLGGMTRPENVLGFLDITGVWKPALVFVMAGAILIYFFGFRIVMSRQKPIFDSEFHVPEFSQVTKSLVIGSILFGVGWGLSGFCPGPAIVCLGAGSTDALLFTAFMVIGMGLHRSFLAEISE